MEHSPPDVPAEIRAALAELLSELPTLLKQFDRRIFWIPGSAEELHQRVATKAWESIVQFRPEADLKGSLRKWIAGIARHVCADMAREAYRKLEPIDDSLQEQARADGLSPSRVMVQDDALSSLADCLLKLEATDRLLLIRVCVERRLGAQVAAEFNLTKDQLDHRLRRSKRKLRDCWGSSGAYRFVAGG